MVMDNCLDCLDINWIGRWFRHSLSLSISFSSEMNQFNFGVHIHRDFISNRFGTWRMLKLETLVCMQWFSMLFAVVAALAAVAVWWLNTFLNSLINVIRRARKRKKATHIWRYKEWIQLHLTHAHMQTYTYAYKRACDNSKKPTWNQFSSFL